MKNIISVMALVLSVGACIVAGVIGSRVIKDVEAMKKVVTGEEDRELRKRINVLESRLGEVKASIGQMNAKTGTGASLSTAVKGEGMSAEVSDILVAMNDSLFQLEQIVDSSGIKAFATNEMVDPLILKEVYDEYHEKKLVKTHREKMEEMNDTFHVADNESYDEELQKTYEKARFHWGKKDKPEMRKKALDELLETYPDAYATGMILAENAMVSAVKNDLAGAEQYYSMLADNSNFSEVVTDWNLKAVPTMQYYLATQYIEKNRIDEAYRMINELERNNETMVFVGGEGSKYQTMQKAVTGLRAKIGN